MQNTAIRAVPNRPNEAVRKIRENALRVPARKKQNFETDFKREQRCKGQQQNRQHSNQCVAETAPAEKRLPSEIKTDKEVIEEICVDEVGKHNRQVGRDAQLLSIVNRTIGEKEKKCRQQNVPTHENQAAAY